MKKNDAGNPLEKGNALKNKNFDKLWFHVLWIMVLLLVVIFGAFWLLHR